MAQPNAFAAFVAYRDRHVGESIVVCGCGASLALLRRPERFVTIGVNDVGRCFTPDYLVVLNEKRQFTAERYAHVEGSLASAVFSQLALAHPRTVRFRLGRRGGTGGGDPECLDYSNNSPYVAVNLARHMGARRIGVIGVDFDDARHPLAKQLPQIEREFAALVQACAKEGVEVVNLSPTSRLTSLPRVDLDTWAGRLPPSPGLAPSPLRGEGWGEGHRACPSPRHINRPVPSPQPSPGGRGSECRVFFVHYKFLSCGTVFETGLREAANTLGVTHEHADWSDPQLPQKVERFRPDLLFVVHGRRFVQRWGDRFKQWRSAVWLLDEPYEVDDTAAWSGHFDCVFVNDPSTLARHRHAHALPVAYAPALHHPPDKGSAARRYRVGFVGGANPSRERLLAGLARRGLLDYVVGGPWREARLGAICLSANIPAEETAALYRDTQIVINVFRDRHHYNREALGATTMNPRIAEALACGALVLSEPRSALTEAVPELPTFTDEEQAAALLQRFLSNPDEMQRVQHACAARLADATYAERLRSVMEIALERPVARPAFDVEPPSQPTLAPQITQTAAPTRAFDDDWLDLGEVARIDATTNGILIEPGPLRGAAAERGLASKTRFDAVDLSFEACLSPGACLLAKVHQADQLDQSSNSYHLWIDERRAYLARHRHVFRKFEAPRRHEWVRLRIVCREGVLSLYRNDQLLHRVRDAMLVRGHAFIGAQGGAVQVRQLSISVPEVGVQHRPLKLADDDAADVLRAIEVAPPRLSIITTVYDRTQCLERCIASVKRLRFRNYEHIIVADHPPEDVMARVADIVEAADDARIGLINLRERHNDWGIAPAAVGLRRARGEYLCFLSDDNGYTPDHADNLIRVLDAEPTLGFAYSSCRYDGRLVLSHPVPRPARIDLGQPMFRRELFELHLGDDLPFDMMAWDWYLIDALMRRGVRWRHVDRQSFIFRLAKYPQLMAS
ncbi:glycosyltransferase [Variovorax sp. J22R133]|uniref:glycosyltransferase family protein n=1 Tax=Variovorax brevis TaxID=3053503 RepID=UPI002578C098|nr:glycosyltransferase [Variovorax sp. J22R133]MDM0112236.1 glycosyltransferase [Variovorax sp. J22R133]